MIRAPRTSAWSGANRPINQGPPKVTINTIAADDTATAARTVHAAFNLAGAAVSLCVVGTGVVGGELLDQIARQREALLREHGLRVNVVAIATSRRLLVDLDGLDLGDWRDALAGTPEAEPVATGSADSPIAALLPRMRGVPTPILVER